MTTTSSIASFRRALVAQLRTVCDPIPVVYIASSEGTIREAIFLGDSAEATVDDPSLKAGRRTRDERIDHYIEIEAYRSFPEDSEAKAAEILDLVYDTISDPVNLAAIRAASEIDWCVPTNVTLSTQTSNETNVVTTIRVTIQSFKRLSS